MAPVMLAPVRSAPASRAADMSAPERLAPFSDMKRRSTKRRLAPEKSVPSPLADCITARIRPIDWFFMSAPRLAPAKVALLRVALVKSAVMRALEKSAPSKWDPRNWLAIRLEDFRLAPEK